MDRTNERGVAMIVALFMVLVLSVLGTSLMFVARAETVSSQNYRLMSQARYGAEAAVHSAANFLINNTYNPPSTDAAQNAVDPLTGYDINVSPVTLTGDTAPVVLSSDTGDANYPIAAVRDAFAAASQGVLDVNDGTVQFTATATLLSMRELTDGLFNTQNTLQTWQIVGRGVVPGANPAQVEVSVIVERQSMPVFAYAAFAIDDGCAALSFAGGALTNSYSSDDWGGAKPTTFEDHTGNVGSNGNLTEYGNPTIINGSMSTPRKGVGTCSSNNVTAQTVIGNATLGQGIVQLPQKMIYPNVPTMTVTPPQTNMHFTQNGGCPGGLANCVQIPNGSRITPPDPTVPYVLGDVTFNGNVDLELTEGVYYVNSLTMSGSAKLKISGEVEIHVMGAGQNIPLTITGDGIVNDQFIPANLKFFYGGTGEVQLAGGDNTAAVFYAPNATASITGGSDLYGSIIVDRLTATGGAAIHYDRSLENEALTPSPYMMSAFTWKVE